MRPHPARAGAVTRLAPSPTGALHLGNARTFLVNWALARRLGWRIVLRIEDLDGPRIKPEATAGIMRTLEWLGIDWDEGPYIQSADLEPYQAAITRLVNRGLVFVCPLTRTEIEAAASAPQDGSHEVAYPAHLRPEARRIEFVLNRDAEFNFRFRTPSATIEFVDGFAGPQAINPARTVGDFIVWTKRGTPAYQLAVVVDDHRQGVTHIVRGDDLLDSAARQILLYRALGLGPEPTHFHLPLVIGPDGKRLAKRHGDSRIDLYRELGVPVEAVIGLIAGWCGVNGGVGGYGGKRQPMSAREFMAGLDLSTMARTPVVFNPEDDAWLRTFA